MNYNFFLKSKNQFLLLLLILLFSCNFNPFQSEEDIWDGKVYTIPELFDSDIIQDGKTYLVEGYIFELNYFPESERFLLYPGINIYKGITYHNVNINVVKNSSSIFNKIINAFENTDEEWILITIRGEAKEITIAGNGWSDDIFVMEIDAIRISD
ncbi:MAG: hypothetical protein KAU01_12045 [Candidatus Cloacimonetes bacterium]|nr:hypothetical protein [Candidatus Cloacimonadota bacterium]